MTPFDIDSLEEMYKDLEFQNEDDTIKINLLHRDCNDGEQQVERCS